MDSQNLLWERIKKGDIDAFEEMYTLYYQSLFVFGIKICGDKNLVKDTLHELFIELWISRERINIRRLPEYLRTVARRKIIKQLAGDPKISYGVPPELPSPSYEELLVDLQNEEEMKEKVKKALSELSPRQLEIVKLKFFEDKSYDEIADITSATSRTVYNQMYEALKTLRKYIKSILF